MLSFLIGNHAKRLFSLLSSTRVGTAELKLTRPRKKAREGWHVKALPRTHSGLSRKSANARR